MPLKVALINKLQFMEFPVKPAIFHCFLSNDSQQRLLKLKLSAKVLTSFAYLFNSFYLDINILY